MSNYRNPYNKMPKQKVAPYIKYEVESSYGMWNWIVDGIINYFNFYGRARRKAFWYFTLANVTLLIAAKISQVTQVMPPEVINLLEVITIALAIPMVSVTARRLHDTERSGFMQLIAIIPFGIFVLIYFLCQDSSPQTNQWGPPAKQVH